jgi:ribonuclease R
MVDDPYLTREAEKYSDPIPSREYILSYLAQRQTPADRQTLCGELGLISESHQEALRRRLRAMERDGQLVFTRRQCYALPERLDLVRGRVLGHRDGYGFLRIEGCKEDLFLSFQQMRQVIHGDEILAQPTGMDRRGRREARVVRVLVPRQGNIVGRYRLEVDLGFVVPDDQRLNFEIAIKPDCEIPVQAGQVVVVQLLQRPTQRHQAVGQIMEILGDHLAPGIEIEMAIRNYDIPHEWPEAVGPQIAALTDVLPPEAMEGRVDLRSLSLVTIDGEDARDFDDAVYCEPKRGGGWRLWVAIADVSHYVRSHTPLDEEARKRGNSVYFPLQVVPMLPERLSNGLCSLNPLVDRLCLVCEMTVSAHGKLSSFKFYEAVMHSRARLTYTHVAQLLASETSQEQPYAPLLPRLQTLHQLFTALKNSRELRGGIEFETQETQFLFNAQRRIERIVPLVRNDAHKMIEECMLLANTAAAHFVQKHSSEAVLYRVHDAPNEERLTAFRKFLKELNLTLGGGSQPSPKDYATLMKQTIDRPDSELIQAMLLRSMQPALYTPENRGHFGLALPAYAHFTSPIRRYPDLTLHRTIKALLTQPAAITAPDQEVIALEQRVQLGTHCSMTERRADEATREVADWLKCEFMQEHVGEQFRGVIANVTGFGFFVRLEKLFIDGLVHVSTLDNDYYQFDAVGQRLIGETSGMIYRLGDVVQVKVAAVYLDQRKIDFVLVSSERPSRTKRTKRAKGADPATAERVEKRVGGAKKRHKQMTVNSIAVNSLDELLAVEAESSNSQKPRKSRKRRSKSLQGKGLKQTRPATAAGTRQQ